MAGGIVAGYDGSPGSQQALDWAAWEATARGLALTVCHVLAAESADPGDGAAGPAWRYAESVVAAGVRRVQRGGGAGDVRPLLLSGRPAGVLCEVSGSADMVVLGSPVAADSPGILGGARLLEAGFEDMLAKCESDHPEVVVRRRVTQGAPRGALLDAASGAQLLVVGARGRGGLRGISSARVCLRRGERGDWREPSAPGRSCLRHAAVIGPRVPQRRDLRPWLGQAGQPDAGRHAVSSYDLTPPECPAGCCPPGPP